ncbi:ROK family protein [Erysipelothrix piscisicarius]|uniref:ROK family protein n=1 Tax=Erysipelothrix piscisicarius TaxID=2485784 RepID=A0A3S8RM15_9FIRM|nr:ROK family protein [Erysipelothrix piscisicarius]AZK43903.1 ROK family protein [Erysipelothrix piscisicarius]
MKYFVFDWGGTSVKYALWDGEALREHGAFKTPTTWEHLKIEMLERFKPYQHKVAGIAISTPGSVDIEKGVIGGLSAIDYIHNFEIVTEMESLFGLPVSIENDANCAALAESWRGVAKDLNNILFVVIGTGIGGAVIVDGVLQRGTQRFAGEFGCMIFDGETTWSMAGTAVHMAERYCLRSGLALDSVSGAEVFQRAERDPIALEEVHKFYDALALGLYNLQFTLDPECIVLGGGVSKHPELISELNHRITSLLKQAQLEDVNINLKACAYHNDANLIGAVASHLSQCGGGKS